MTMARWTEHLRATRAPNTVAAYSEGAELLVAWLKREGYSDLDQVDDATMQRFADALAVTNSPRTVRLRVSGAQSFLRFHGITVKYPKIAHPGRRKPLHLDENQLLAYMEAVRGLTHPVNRAVLLLLPYTGLRISEALALRRSAITRHDDGYWITVTGKRDKTRDIPLAPQAVRDLDEYLRLHWPNSRSDHELFPTSYKSVYDTFQGLRARLGIPWLSPHKLRHTFATYLRENDVELDDVRELLGHASLNTTLIYAHPTRKGLRSAVVRGFGRKTMREKLEDRV